MQTLKFKVQPTKAFFATVTQSNVQRLLPGSVYYQALLSCVNCAQQFDNHTLGSSQKFAEATKFLLPSIKCLAAPINS